MNLLKKQGFYNSIILYIGTALGFFNLIILFQRVLTAEQIGFFGLLTSVSLLFTQVASLGFSSVITRYFPFFKTDNKHHNGFPLYVLKFTSISFVIVALFYILGKEVIQQFQQNTEGSSLFFQYYYLVIPVSLFTLWYGLAETFARTTFHNIVPSFLREVLLKILTAVLILLLFLQTLNYQLFVIGYVVTNAIILLILLVYLKKLDLIRFKKISESVTEKSPEIIKYGLYSMLAGGSFAMIQNIDLVVLKLFTQEATVGYYYTFFSVAMVISLPAKALNTTSYQIIANAWKTHDLEKINKIYSKTSLVQFLVGCILFIGLIANWENILVLLNKPEYRNYYFVFIVVGVGFLFDITGGLNGAIISFSKHYKLVMYILIAAAIVCVILNFILIPKFGMLGAAISYTSTMFLLNFTYWLYLFIKYDLQPFNVQFIKLAAISALVLVIGIMLPKIDSFFLDVPYRSITMLILYAVLIYSFKISEDINQFIKQILSKVNIIK
jgi:O-antigen/teichoic acid export membrane protein